MEQHKLIEGYGLRNIKTKKMLLLCYKPPAGEDKYGYYYLSEATDNFQPDNWNEIIKRRFPSLPKDHSEVFLVDKPEFALEIKNSPKVIGCRTRNFRPEHNYNPEILEVVFYKYEVLVKETPVTIT